MSGQTDGVRRGAAVGTAETDLQIAQTTIARIKKQGPVTGKLAMFFTVVEQAETEPELVSGIKTALQADQLPAGTFAEIYCRGLFTTPEVIEALGPEYEEALAEGLTQPEFIPWLGQWVTTHSREMAQAGSKT